MTRSPSLAVINLADRRWFTTADAAKHAQWYTLFGEKSDILEAILGESIEQARKEFFEYASVFAGGQNPDNSMLQVAERYAAV